MFRCAEQALLKNQPRGADVIATTLLRVLVIAKADFQAIVGMVGGAMDAENEARVRQERLKKSAQAAAGMVRADVCKCLPFGALCRTALSKSEAFALDVS